MIKVLPSFTVDIINSKTNRVNNKYIGRYRIPNGKSYPFIMLYNRKTKKSRFTDPIEHPSSKDYLVDLILKKAQVVN